MALSPLILIRPPIGALASVTIAIGIRRPDAFTAIERAPDLAGAPDTGNIVRVATLPPGVSRHLDRVGRTGLQLWYRARHEKAGWTPSAFTDWVAAFPTDELAIDTITRRSRVEPFADRKFAVTASDTGGKDIDDDVFVKATKTVKVGTVASPSSITKPLRFPAAVLVPATEERAWEFFSLIYVNPGATGAGNQLTLIGSLPLPKGVTLTAFRVRHYRNAVGDFARSALYRISGEVASSLAIVTHDTTGYQTQSAGISQLVGDEQYMIFVELTSDAGSGVTGARFVWVELDYTMPDYSKGY